MNDEANSKLNNGLKKFQLWIITTFSTFIVIGVLFIFLMISLESLPSAELIILQDSEEEESEKLAELQEEFDLLITSTKYTKMLEVKDSAFLAETEETEQAEKQEAEAKENEALQIEEKAEGTLAKLTAEQDQMEKVTWYQDPTSPVYVNKTAVYLSIGIKEGSRPALDLHIQYAYDDTWLFVDSFAISADDNSYNVNPGYSAIHRDNSAHSRWEWYIHRAESNTDHLMLSTMANSSTTIVRLNGDDYYHEIKLTQQQKQAMKDVLDAYFAQVEKYEYLESN